MPNFEGYERRIAKINEVLKANGFETLEQVRELLLSKGIDVEKIVRKIQPIAFENAVWAYTLGAGLALKRGNKTAAEAARSIGDGLKLFIPAPLERDVGHGHGNLAAMLLSDETDCFAFLAGHESFAAAEGAIGIANTANQVRKTPLRVILNGLGKDAAYIISRINGFTSVETKYDYYTDKLTVVREKAFSDGERAKVRCYGADDVNEGVAIMRYEKVDVSITGNSTNPTRFQHPVAGTYQKWATEHDKKYFSVASGGAEAAPCTPTTWQPVPLAMRPIPVSYALDAQFAGSSSVPAHVEMMGLIGMGNNPMVGATVAVAVAIEQSFQ